MKKLATLFSIVGFVIQYLLPIIIFGDVVHYTRGGAERCLTVMGYLAIALALFFIAKKVKEWILQKPKSLKRALILSLFPIVWWLAIMLGVDALSAFVVKFAAYWDKVIIFILLGRGCYVISETILGEGDDR
jgi:mannitol-specific phosphotransferase system IIBC component